MKKFLMFVSLLWAGPLAYAQTFNGQGNMLIPPGAPSQTVGITQSPCTVTGVGVLGGCTTIESVEIDVQHTWVGDIGILLIGPGGQILDLSTGNGGAGDNFTNTIFTDMASSFITSGSPPYSGSFRPEGRATTLSNPYSNGPPLGTHTFANTYNGTNADGVWTLYINDYVPADVGLLISWSITFGNSGTVTADAGPDVTICTGSSTLLTATGGGTYLWSNGATTANTTVMPGTATTYTVTVTQPGCGTDTDEVIVSVQSGQVSITANPPAICPGQTTTLTASSTLPNFTWSNSGSGPSITVSSGGTYSVTASDGMGCTATATITVTVNPKPAVSFTISNPNICPGDCPTFGVNFTGTPPFNLSGDLTVFGIPIGNFSQSYNSNTGSLTICIPPATPTGSIMIKATSLTDAFCTCN